MIRSSLITLFVSVFILLTGCVGTAVVQPGNDIAGVYRLVAVNGIRVPGEIRHDGAILRIENGSFRIDADGNITSQTDFVPPEGDRVTRRVRATYTRDGANLLMRWEGAGTTRGTLDGSVFVMNNHGMVLVYSRSGEIDPSVDLAQLGRCDPAGEITTPAAGVFDAFETSLVVDSDCYGNSIGFFTFRDSSRTRVDISTTSSHPARPGEAASNRVVQMDLEVEGWAGVIHNFENAAADRWSARDWRAFEAFSFWIHGNNSGTPMFVDILDNRNPGSTYDDAERYTHTFSDNFSGWKKITVPFGSMIRKPIGNRAPADGLGLAEVHGWGLGTLRTDGSLTFYLDDFELIE